ncbi:hypothetical protein PanWU01x14_149320 [Parasponia andersonii]|uniref:Uncharacterized protein n=1 Tax=Parasponia andersonii TaxID=3476 RepID=A0A2P5CIY6_PARAD|nr:hypothetical protein PanWU01x14_149320 [Parasponia andersonii]
MAAPNQHLSFLSSMVPLALKLDHTNIAFWCTQILPTVCAHDLEGFLLSTRLCPEQYFMVQEGEGSSQPGSVVSQPIQCLSPKYMFWIRMDQALIHASTCCSLH